MVMKEPWALLSDCNITSKGINESRDIMNFDVVIRWVLCKLLSIVSFFFSIYLCGGCLSIVLHVERELVIMILINKDVASLANLIRA